MPSAAGDFCGAGAISSFPNYLEGLVDARKFETIPNGYVPLDFEFQWAQESARPTFLANDSTVGEIYSSSGASNSLRYAGKSYTLAKVQLTDAYHASWLIPATQSSKNYEDIVFTFSVEDPAANPRQIIIVVPILQTQSGVDGPNFLKKMITSTDALNFDPNTAVSYSEFFPPAATAVVSGSTLHGYYTICARGVNSNDPAQNIMVVVQTTGLEISQGLMYLVKQQFNNPGQTYGAYIPLVGTELTVGRNSNFSEAMFQERVKYAYNLGEPRRLAPSTPVSQQAAATAPSAPVPAVPAGTELEMSADAFKCVPFDPDTQIVDGKVVIDATTGKPIAKLNADRTQIQTEAKGTDLKIKDSHDFIQYASIALGSLMGLIVLLLILYFLFTRGGGTTVPGQTQAATARMVQQITDMSPYLVFSSLFGIIGFIIGISMAMKR